MDFWQSLSVGGIIAILTGLLGFYLGRFKEFKENKHKAYSTILPIIIEVCYNHQNINESKYNQAIILSWLYSNKKVAKILDKIASIIVEPKRGDIVKETQNLIIEMRKDIQPFFWQRLKAKDVKHIYTIFK
jgi:PII-like signaling protein